MAAQFDEPVMIENPMDHELGDQDDEEQDALAEFLEDIRAAKSCVRCFNIVLLILGAGLAVFAFVGGELLLSFQWLVWVGAGIGIAIVFTTLLGLVGACFDVFRGILVLYYTLLVFLTLFLMILSGFCFVLTDTAVRYVERSFDSLVLEVDSERRSTITLSSVVVDLRLFLFGTGGVALVLMLLLLIVMANVVRLVTPLKAYSVLLQATNLAIVPLGIALIAAGLYVGDTAASIEAPFAAFAVFLMGFLVVFFAVVGCVGVTINSRGIIRLYQFLVGILGILFLGFGLAALVISGQVQEQLVTRWDSIRTVLPPSFSGKYDVGQFEAFVETNLKAVGFMAVCAGVVLLVQLWAAGRLRQELKKLNDLENKVDERFASLANVVAELQQTEKDHRDARKELQRAGNARAAVNVLAATMAEECQTEFERMADSLENLAEVEGWDDDDIQERLRDLPPRWSREEPLRRALRQAEWSRVRLLARKLALEEEISTLDTDRLEAEGAGGVQEAQRRMSVKNAGGGDDDGGAAGGIAAGASSSDPEAKFIVPKRHERPMNAGALFWKRWWTKGTPGSRRAVICCCVAVSFIVIAILGVATAALYFATSCAVIATDAMQHTHTDLTTSVFWVDHKVTRGSVSLVPAAVTAPTLALRKSAIQKDMLSAEFPTPAPETQAPEGSTEPRPGLGVVVEEPPPARFLSFDVACQNNDATFNVPQRAQTTSARRRSLSLQASSASSTPDDEAESRNVQRRVADVSAILSARLLPRGRSSSRSTSTTRTTASASASSASAAAGSSRHDRATSTATSPIEQVNDNKGAGGDGTLTPDSPGPWLDRDLVAAIVDAIERAAAQAAITGNPFSTAPQGHPDTPELRARMLGNLGAVSLDWTSTPHAARPFTGAIEAEAIASAELTGVMVGGRGAQMTTQQGDVGLANGGAVCDPALLGSDEGGLRFSTKLGTVSLLDSVVYGCDVRLSGEASLVRVVNTALLNENGGSNAVLSGTKGSLLVEDSSAERLTLQGSEGSARVLNTEVSEALKVSTTTGAVLVNKLVAGARAVVQIETSEGSVTIHAQRFSGIVSIVTSGAVSCDGEGLHLNADGTNPCTSTPRDTSGLLFVEEARVNCVRDGRDDCAYMGELTVVSNSGSVALTFDSFDATTTA